MFGSSMLDIVLGIVFVFLLLSIFATAINEIIMSFLGKRGKDLLLGIQTLLGGDHAKDIVSMIYNHGQVYGLYKGPFDPQKPGDLPSYIPSRNFALALLDSAGQYLRTLKDNAKAAQKTLTDAMSTGNVDLTVADQSLKLALAAFSAASQAAATQKQITAQQQKAAPPIAPTPAPNPAPGTVAATAQTVVAIGQDIKDGAAALAANPHTAKVGRPLVAMIAMAGDDANKLQTAVEAWYNSGMDRVSGWYKYRTQWFLLIIGFVMAVVINADTIHIARQLSIDPTLRQSIVAAANHVKYPAQASTANPASPTAGQATTTVAQPAPATTAQTPATPATASQPTPATGQPSTGDLSTQIKAASNAFDNIHTLGLPLGWPSDAPRLYTLQNYSYLGVNRPQLLPNGKFWEALLGWFLTAIAISLGAPFWFDALNKIMVIRSTVKPTEKSKDEASKS